jgi:hypothetical protein
MLASKESREVEARSDRSINKLGEKLPWDEGGSCHGLKAVKWWLTPELVFAIWLVRPVCKLSISNTLVTLNQYQPPTTTSQQTSTSHQPPTTRVFICVIFSLCRGGSGCALCVS